MKENLTQISYIEKLPAAAGNVNFDFDIVLPEYYDTVSKILDCSLTPVCEAVNISGDKINVSGIGKIKLLYIGEDKKFYCYKNEQKYTKIFLSNDITASASIDIEQHISSFNFRALGPKRVSAKANIMMSVIPAEIRFCDLVNDSDENNIEVNKVSDELIMPCALSLRDISVSGELIAEEIKEQISEIVRYETVLLFNEIKPIKNKLYLNGNCIVSLLCLTENNTFVKPNRFTLPFSEILDIDGIEENSQCYIGYRINDTKIDISEYNGTNKLSVNILSSIKVSSFIQNNVSYINDIFSTEKELKTIYNEVEIINKIEKKNETVTVTSESETFVENEYEIIDTWVDELTATIAQSKDSTTVVVLSGNFKVLIKTADGEINCILRNFSKDLSVCEYDNSVVYDSVKLSMLSISSSRSSSKSIKTSMDISVEITLYDRRKVNLLSSFTLNSSEKLERVKGVILYFACKGENIWEIAKANRTSVEKIMNYNSIGESVLTNDTMLILPNL